MDTTVKGYIVRFIKLIVGLAIGSFGVMFTINANLGLSPWDVFAQGIAVKVSAAMGTEVLLGTIIQIVGVFVLLIVILLKEKIGVGTLCDILVFGQFMNIYTKLGVVPTPQTLPMRLLFLLIGFSIWSIGVYVYMSAGLGAGPRDSLMAALTKRNIPVSLAKNGTESVVLLIGFLLGGQVGIGTVVAVFIMGYMLKIVFGIFDFDIKTVHNDSVVETVMNLKKTLTKVPQE
ncbi:MAG: hypothetical protein RR827_04465 [Oscillospiraceae bacterium]